MHDQNSIRTEESNSVKYQRALDLFTESVYKPDPDLRGCAHNQGCFDELMEIRDCLLYTSPSPRDSFRSRMPSSA